MFETLEYVERECLGLIESRYGAVEDVSCERVVDGFDITMDFKDSNEQLCLEFKKEKDIKAYMYTTSCDPFADQGSEYSVKVERDITDDIGKLLSIKFALLAIRSRKELLGLV